MQKQFLFGPSIFAGAARERLIWSARICGTIMVLNLIDGLATLIWVLTNRATEANPLMAILVEFHPVAFIALKVMLVNLGAVLLLRYCYRFMASAAIMAALIVYSLIVLFHSIMFWNVVL
jgi:hypothetical protein